ncbi:unnamed protein product [Allacma fusca]|uniref:C2H2-type domain-containing protein n=1 Tax=Allacma fusca TaxID=39272 RepID=A0A8J2P6D6_9HEXA|nr:unnamed protein product [Allacma fusca]
MAFNPEVSSPHFRPPNTDHLTGFPTGSQENDPMFRQIIQSVESDSAKPYLCGYCSFKSADINCMKYHIDHDHCQRRIDKDGGSSSLLNNLLRWCLKSPDRNPQLRNSHNFPLQVLQDNSNNKSYQTQSSEAGKPSFQCKFCNSEFGCKLSCRKHEILHFLNKYFPCAHCMFISPSLQVLTKHRLEHHTAEKDEISTQSRHPSNYPTQTGIIYTPYVFECGFCKFSAQNSNSLEAHLRKVHFPYLAGQQCQVCGLAFSKEEDFWNHVTYKHTPEFRREPFGGTLPVNQNLLCSFCNGRFFWEEAFFTHLLGW